jgi:hypothetical protein
MLVTTGAGVLTDFFEIQPVDLADQSDKLHVQVDGIIVTAPSFRSENA